jgi:ubiquinone/menaquinone biosynthesis C-methylase UbiE
MEQHRQHYNEQVADLFTADQKTRDRWITRVRGYLQAPYGRVLDVGCGDGASSLLLAADAQLLVGVDFSLPMLRRGKKRLEGLGIGNAAFVLGDIARLPFKAGAFDAVVSVNALHEVSLEIGLPGIRRVLRAAGGRLMIRDVTIPPVGQRARGRYIWFILRQIPIFIRERGLRGGLRKLRLKLDPEWVEGLYDDHKLPVEEHLATYREHLPGCTLEVNGRSVLATWEAPAEN